MVARVETKIELNGNNLAEDFSNPRSEIFRLVSVIYEIISFAGRSTNVAQFICPFQYSSVFELGVPPETT